MKRKEVYGIRFHGSGGQGVVIGSYLYTEMCLKEGNEVQDAPFFGVERRGAPVKSSLRISKSKIWDRSEVTDPHAIVFFKETGINEVTASGLRDDGWIIANTSLSPEKFITKYPWLAFANLALVDANSIARKHGIVAQGHPIVNTTMLGAVAKVTGTVKSETLRDVIHQTKAIRVKQEQNANAAAEAYDTVIVIPGDPIAGEKPEQAAAPKPPDSAEKLKNSYQPTTGNNTGSWRFGMKPVVDEEKCRKGGGKCQRRCFIYCPESFDSKSKDGAIMINQDGVCTINYSKCKGCEVCAVECPRRAITMEAEE